MNINSLFCTLSMFLVAAFFFIVSYSGGREDQKKNKKIAFGGICLMLTIMLVFFLFISKYIETATSEMYRRLNQPIVSEEQLYGYKIVGKKSFYKSSVSTYYFIDIEDLLGDEETLLKNIVVSNEFYSTHKIGDRFLQEDKPDTPTTESQ